MLAVAAAALAGIASGANAVVSDVDGQSLTVRLVVNAKTSGFVVLVR